MHRRVGRGACCWIATANTEAAPQVRHPRLGTLFSIQASVLWCWMLDATSARKGLVFVLSRVAYWLSSRPTTCWQKCLCTIALSCWMSPGSKRIKSGWTNDTGKRLLMWLMSILEGLPESFYDLGWVSIWMARHCLAKMFFMLYAFHVVASHPVPVTQILDQPLASRFDTPWKARWLSLSLLVWTWDCRWAIALWCLLCSLARSWAIHDSCSLCLAQQNVFLHCRWLTRLLTKRHIHRAGARFLTTALFKTILTLVRNLLLEVVVSSLFSLHLSIVRSCWWGRIDRFLSNQPRRKW